MKVVFAWVAVLGLFASPALADKKLDDAVAKAEDQVAKGRPDEAVKTLQKAATQSPGSEAQLALASLQAKLGNWDEAAAAHAKAKELSATEPPATKSATLAAVAFYHLSVGTAKDALAAAEAAVEAQPTSEALAALARAQVRSNDAPAAQKTADKAIAAGATSAAAHEAKATVLASMGLVPESTAEFRKALEIDPKMTRARAGLAVLLASAGKGVEAVAEAKKATEADPKSGEAFAALGQALLAENPKAWSEAIAQAQQGAFLNPKSPLIQLIVGKIFEANAALDQATSAYKKALETDPGFTPARLALVTVQWLQGDKGVLADVQTLAKEIPNNGEVQYMLGRALMRNQDFTNALPALEKAVALSPGLADALALYATAAFYNGKNDLAVSAYKRALDLKPESISWRTDYGLFLARNGNYDEAVVQLKKVVSSPGYKDAAGWVNLGYVYRNMKPPKVEDSVAAYKKAVELDPKEEQAALGLGWAYLTSQKYDESIAAYNRALQIEPKLAPDVYGGIAWSHFFKKDMDQALAFAAKAKEAGRPVSGLAEQVDRYKKAMAAGAAGGAEADRAVEEAKRAKAAADAANAINENLHSKNAGTRMRAARDLANSGSPDAVTMLVWMLTNDKDWGVKQVVASSLGNLGAAAKPALPYLKQCSNPCSATIVMTDAEMAENMLCEDARRACQTAAVKIPK